MSNVLAFAALLKLSRPAILSPRSRVRTIFLPSPTHVKINPTSSNDNSDNDLEPFYQQIASSSTTNDEDSFDRNENYLRTLHADSTDLMELISRANREEIARRQQTNAQQQQQQQQSVGYPSTDNQITTKLKSTDDEME